MRAIVYMKTDSKSEHITAVGLLLVTAVLWSFGGVLIKLISWNPLAIAGGRSILAAGVLLFVVRRDHLTCSFDQMAGAVCYAAKNVEYLERTSEQRRRG